jgi:uncharacterized protein
MPYAKNSELPKNVSSLPEAAKTIWRKAFNSALDQGYDEERSAKIAWAAVKRSYKKEGDKWVTKDSAYPLSENLTFDDAADIKMTSDGYLVAQPRVARTGIQTYRGWEVGRPDMDEVRIYRPYSSVMDKKSIASLAHKPITLGHPSEMVNASNWDEYAVGQSGDEIMRDGEFLRIPLIVMDQKAIDRIKDGHEQLSIGYYSDLEWKDGETEAGESYDAIQRNIEANHIAIVAQARGGHKLKLGDNNKGDTPMPKTITVDGITVSLEDRDAAIVTRHMQKLDDEIKKYGADIVALTTDRDAQKKAAETKDGEIAVLKKKIEDEKITPQMLDEKVAERVTVVTKAKAILGDHYDSTGKTNIEIKKAVVATKLGDAAKTMVDAAVDGAFTAMTIDADKNISTGLGVTDLARSLGTRTAQNSRQLADEAWDKRGEQLRDAWKGNKATA